MMMSFKEKIKNDNLYYNNNISNIIFQNMYIRNKIKLNITIKLYSNLIYNLKFILFIIFLAKHIFCISGVLGFWGDRKSVV